MDRGQLVGPNLKGLPRGDFQQSLGLLSMAAPPVAGDVLGLLADGMVYAKDPSSLTPVSGLLSLAGLIPGVPSFGIAKQAGRIAEKKIGDATVIYQNGPEMVELISLRVPQSKRGRGEAKKAMQAFLSDADAAGVPVKLQASPLDSKTSLPRLVKFYESLGFVRTGLKINSAGDPEMFRPVLSK